MYYNTLHYFNGHKGDRLLDVSGMLQQVAIAALPTIFAITFHEAAHGYAANKLGDPTARMLGRLSLNPARHIDPIGTVLLPLMLYLLTDGRFVFGYAKPVPINPLNFKDPRRDTAISSAAGPLTNITLALISIWMLRLLDAVGGSIPENIAVPLGMMVNASIIVNVVLAAVNLMPVPPLDGGRVVAGLLPHRQAAAFERIEPYGMFIVIILLVTKVSNYIIYPIAKAILWVLGLLS